MNQRTAALMIWDNLYGQPYRWGGSDTIAGFDCSGFCLEGLKSVGLCPPDADFSASQILNELFKNRPHLSKEQIKPGCLVFWANQNGHIYHIEVVWQIINGLMLTIGASGGGSQITTIEAAEKADAYVKVRPRNDWNFAIDPFND